MNILITGASRGIGAAAYALLKKTGHKVVGHSTRGSDVLVAGDLADPGGAAQHLGHRARRARRPDRRAGQQCRHLRRRPRQCRRRRVACRLAAHADHQPAIRGGPQPPRRVAFPRPRHSRADRQCREPRRLSRRQPPALALCGVEGRAGGDDQDDRARLCRRWRAVLRGRARLHRLGNDRRISGRAAAARRSSPTSRWAGSRPPTRSPR